MAKFSAHAEDFFVIFISHNSLFLLILIKQRVLSFSSESAQIGIIPIVTILGFMEYE
jgi:hypothetical protein